jgi:diguanylate cyclase (GGDEF)-like protein/PAS domain S-box-containing protein
VSAAPLPANEIERLAALHDLRLLDSAHEPVFDAIAQLAASICEAPIALVGLVDRERQWFTARVGLDAEPTPREQTFCAHAILSPQLMEVGDARDDTRFRENPFVTGDPNIRFYAGMPLRVDATHAVGTLCVIDRKPRQLSPGQRDAMQNLALVLERLFDARRETLAAQRALHAIEARTRTITDNVPAAICYIDQHRHYRYNNAAYELWLELPIDQVTGRSVRSVHGEESYALIEPHLDRALRGERQKFEIDVVHRGEPRHLRGTYVPEFDAEKRVVGVFGLTQDATSLKLAEDQLQFMARYDALTGLANRYQLYETLDASAARAQRSGWQRALLYLDIDRFKSINDTHGHAVGDLVLNEFARRLRDCVRATDTVARLAGDEFVIVLENLAVPADAHTVAVKVIDAMVSPFDLGGVQLRVTTSVGVAFAEPGEDDADLLLRRADAALYSAKAAGRNVVRSA